MLRWALLAVVLFTGVLAGLTDPATAQPPGAAPPDGVFDQSDEESQIPIDAFFFLSESGDQVMMPGLTWEKIQRLLDQQAGMLADQQRFSYQELQITGSTEQSRAEMEVVLRFTIEPTQGRWVGIPLKMGNFHRLAPPDVSNVDEYFMTLAPGGDGYLLFVKADSRREAMLRMKVSARVETSSAARSLAFQLPDVPVKVELTTDQKNVVGEVIGRGDESIKATDVAGGQTSFLVESGGGTFDIRWGRLARPTDKVPLLEVESRVIVRWNSPQDQPIAEVALTIRNVHGSVDSFQLRLPPDSVVMEPVRLGANGPAIELGTVPGGERGEELREVVIPMEERQERIDLNFDLRLTNEGSSAESPLLLRVPEIVDAIRQRGEIEVRTSGDYRLRWKSTSWIRGELGEPSEDGSSGRAYRFRFDRASFDLPELPLWLWEKERQMRMVSKSQLTVRESTASLEMTIQISGQSSDGRLHLDEAFWRISPIEDAETGEELDSYTADSYRVIEFNAAPEDALATIRVRGEREIQSADGQIQLPLPRVVEIDDPALVQSATLDVINSGRTVLVVDLEASQGLSRVLPSVSDTSSDSTVTSFRIVAQDSPVTVVGTMIDQPPSITLTSAATIELDGDQLRTTVDWDVTSTLDLEGRLPVRIPKPLPLATTQTAVVDDDQASFDPSIQQGKDGLLNEFDVSKQWVVTVFDGVLPATPATLQPRGVEDDHYTLISPRLATGSVKIRWRHVRDWRSGVTDSAIESVSLPRPDFADVTVEGGMQVELRGNSRLDMVALDSPARSLLKLDVLPRDPIRVKLQSLSTRRQELSIRQMILRTVIGHSMRYEQVLATIQGGESFRVGVPPEARDISVEAFVDGERVSNVRRDRNMLTVALPGDEESHDVDLHVWIAAHTPASLATIEPALKLPFGAGRVYWQIVAPNDGHVVWASPTLGRSMSWRFEGWKLYRQPSHGDQALTSMAGSTTNLVPAGNRYLYVGSDLRSFRVLVVSRLVLWICIGSMVLLTSMVLMNFPRSRSPLSAIVAAILFGGLLAMAPDAAVLAGQFAIIALVLVIVMFAIKALITPGRGDRVFTSPGSTPPSKQPSTRSQKKPETPEPVGVSSTQTLAQPPSPTEASS